MRAVACVCLIAACLGVGGCSTFFGKKSKERANPPASQPADARWPGSGSAAGAAAERDAATGVNGILAGRILDSYDHLPPPTFIQVLPGDTKETKAAPIEVAADAQGFFTIHGLRAGEHYHLIARTRDGERKMAGEAWGIPPNPRLLIYVSEDFATGNTPPAPGAPTIPGQKSRPKSGRASRDTTEPSNGVTDQGESRDPPKTANAIPPQRPVDIGRPLKTSEPDVNPSSAPPSRGQAEPRSAVRPEDIVRDAGGLVAAPPVTSIAPQVNATSPRSDSQLSQPLPPAPTRVPSCVLTGRQLDNFALNDLSARPWEYRNRRGRIVLLDFWATYCLPCRQAIPSLKVLQERYGRYGLEVVGIAYEEGPLLEQIRKVQIVRENLGINYQLLLGSDIFTCPVKAQFAIDKFPTLVLIDENSRIIWRSEGLEPYKLQELEMLIRQQLGVR